MGFMNNHDTGRRWLFSDPQMVADLIRGFIREPWVEELDLETLELVSGSFVSETFQRRENDVIWRVKFRDRWLYVYLLLEFQSTVDRLMALRLMVYVGLLYQQLVNEKKVLPGEALPPVLPIVLYNGRTPWRAPRDVADLIAECPDKLAAYRPSMRYFLLEERAQDLDELAGMNNLAAVVFRLEKCKTPEDVRQAGAVLREWCDEPAHRKSAWRIVRWVLRFFKKRSGGEQLTEELTEIRDLGAMLEERVKEWEKELLEKGLQEGIKEGIKKGIKKGMEKGIEKGVEQGEAEVLLRLLERKFYEIPPEYRQRIDDADSSQLLAWAERILTAESIDDVFGD